MKQFSKFIDFSDKPYVIKADIVDAYMQLMDSIDKRKDFIEPKPYDVSLHVNKDFYDDYGYHIYGACKRIGELLGNDRDVHILFTSIHPMVGKLVLSFHESYISKWPPLGVSPKTYKDIINAVYGKTNVSVFSDKAFSPSIKKVIFNPPATIVYWRDGSKTVSKVQDGDTWDSEKGLAMAIIKKTMGLKEFYKHLDEHAVNAKGLAERTLRLMFETVADYISKEDRKIVSDYAKRDEAEVINYLRNKMPKQEDNENV